MAPMCATKSTTRWGGWEVHTRVTDSVSCPFACEYNLANAVTKIHYPSNRDVSTTHNGAGRPEGVTGCASSIGYDAFGGMKTPALGNGVTETTACDSRPRITSLAAQTGESPNQTMLLWLNYAHYQARLDSTCNHRFAVGIVMDTKRISYLRNCDLHLPRQPVEPHSARQADRLLQVRHCRQPHPLPACCLLTCLAQGVLDSLRVVSNHR